MTVKTLCATILITTLIFLTFQPAHAHRMRVFAYESGGMVHTEVKFNSGRAARNVSVIIEDESGAQLLTGTTDDKGLFSFALPKSVLEKPSHLNIIADAGEGHRGNWLLEAEEYSAMVPQETSPKTTQPPAAQPQQKEQDYSGEEIENQQLQQILRDIVAAEVAPIKKMLAEQRQQSLTLQDILGGIGYLLGLAGIAAYFQARKTKNNGEKR